MMLWVQINGLVALLLDVVSVQFKHRQQILMFQIVACFTWVAHFLLLGAVTGGIMNLVGAVRSVSYYRFSGNKRSLWVPIGVIALSVLLTFVFWQGFLSLFPMAANVLAAIAFWQRDEQRIRSLLLLAVPLWFSYNFLYHSYAGILSDTIALMSLLVALYHYRSKGVSKHAFPKLSAVHLHERR